MEASPEIILSGSQADYSLFGDEECKGDRDCL